MATKPKKDGFSVRVIINDEFMGMTPKEIDEFDKMIDKLQKEAKHDLNKAPWQKNDKYQQDVVVKGGESE